MDIIILANNYKILSWKFIITVLKFTFIITVDSKTKCNVLVFKSSRFKEESVNFASWIKEEASSAEEQLNQAIDSCTTLK